MRVGILGIQHEANTFNATPADMVAFIQHVGHQVIDHFTPAGRISTPLTRLCVRRSSASTPPA